MSTHSNINVKVGNSYYGIYCHFDGYPSGVGKTLIENYNTQELAEKLVSLGDIFSVGESINETVYFGRDRGGEDTGYRISKSPLDEEGYCYIFENNEWTMNGTEYDEDDNCIEYLRTPVTVVLGLEEPETGNDEYEDEAQKVLDYFGCSMYDVIAIYNEWYVEFNIPDDKMSDEYNKRTRWAVRHRFAPYNGTNKYGDWLNIFHGSTLSEAVRTATECLARAKAEDAKRKGI